MLEPLDFIARLAALVPPPRVHLTRFPGVFAAHAMVIPAVAVSSLVLGFNLLADGLREISLKD